MRLIIKSATIFSNHILKVFRIRWRSWSKALKQEHVRVINEETLTGRILLYLNTDNRKSVVNSTNVVDSILTDVRNNNNAKCLFRLDVEEIISFLSTLRDREDVDRTELYSILTKVSTECCLRLSNLESKDIFRVLRCYMDLVPNRITQFTFYQQSVNYLFDGYRRKLPKKQLLQLMFYIGLQKKSTHAQSMLTESMKLMDDQFIKDLTVEELCLICNCLFKTSTRITNKVFLEKVRNYINDNLSILKDPALFVTLIKTIRHNQFQNDDLLNTISCGLFFNKTVEHCSFSVICHIMALYSAYSYYDKNLFDTFIIKSLKELEKTDFISKHAYLSEQLRGKDIKRFLWALSIFTEFKPLTDNNLRKLIVPKLIERINAGEFVKDPDSLVDIFFHLWMLNYRAYELVPYTLPKSSIRLIGPKSRRRLDLLLHCIRIEDSSLYDQLKLKPSSAIPHVTFSKHLKQRPILFRVFSNLRLVTVKSGLSRFDLSIECPLIQIVGITGFRNQQKSIYVEVLDEITSIRNVEDDVPEGMMSLKLRLLNRSEEGVLTVSQKEIMDLTDFELQEYLLEEIKLIC